LLYWTIDLAEANELIVRTFGVRRLVKDLQRAQLLPASAAQVLRAVNNMNRALHGADVHAAAAEEAIQIGNRFLTELRGSLETESPQLAPDFRRYLLALTRSAERNTLFTTFLCKRCRYLLGLAGVNISTFPIDLAMDNVERLFDRLDRQPTEDASRCYCEGQLHFESAGMFIEFSFSV
jgi:hypothetical protein